MKRFMVAVFTVAFLAGGAKISSASDWDKAGRILTGIEGLRILTGGRVDVVGTLIGVGQNRGRNSHNPHYKRKKYTHKHYAKHYETCSKRVWVPHYEWHKEYVPAHESYDPDIGMVYVEEHFIKYKVEAGGHWEKTYSCL